MKIALCFSGQPRNVAEGWPSIFSNIITPNVERGHTIDVFVHTWFNQNEVGQQYINAGGHIASSPIPENVLSIISRLYNPKKMLIEHQLEFDECDYDTRKYPGIIPKYSLSKMYSTYKVHQLAKQYDNEIGFGYDMVLSHRFDVVFELPWIADDYDPNYVWHLEGCPHPESLNVISVWGGSLHMEYYSTLIGPVDSYWRHDGIPFCDEPLAYHHLKQQNIQVRTAKIPHKILRNV